MVISLDYLLEFKKDFTCFVYDKINDTMNTPIPLSKAKATAIRRLVKNIVLNIKKILVEDAVD